MMEQVFIRAVINWSTVIWRTVIYAQCTIRMKQCVAEDLATWLKMKEAGIRSKKLVHFSFLGNAYNDSVLLHSYCIRKLFMMKAILLSLLLVPCVTHTMEKSSQNQEAENKQQEEITKHENDSY